MKEQMLEGRAMNEQIDCIEKNVRRRVFRN